MKGETIAMETTTQEFGETVILRGHELWVWLTTEATMLEAIGFGVLVFVTIGILRQLLRDMIQ